MSYVVQNVGDAQYWICDMPTFSDSYLQIKDANTGCADIYSVSLVVELHFLMPSLIAMYTLTILSLFSGHHQAATRGAEEHRGG